MNSKFFLTIVNIVALVLLAAPVIQIHQETGLSYAEAYNEITTDKTMGGRIYSAASIAFPILLVFTWWLRSKANKK